MNYAEVLKFWFEEAGPKRWFSKDDAFDEELRRRFGSLHAQAAAGELVSWRATPEGRLAEIIVLDQFSRNLFRNSPQAFAQDDEALRLAREAVAQGADTQLPRRMRHFLYMPYMHSESRDAHREAMWLFLKSLNWNGFLYELKHKRIIDRFGRYPHRNEVLGRTSTPEEQEFLKTHKGF